MSPENKAKLDKYKKQFDIWVNDKVLVDFDGRAKNEILEVIREEWNPGYNPMLWCGSCVGEMITYVVKMMKE